VAGDTSGVTTGKATDDERLGATPSESSTRSGATLDNGATGRPTAPFHPPPPRGHPERIALRYRIERPLDGGQGGFGTVYAAFDELTRTPVVIKLLPVLSDRQLGDIRREVVSLRQARLPGLVHMLDEGVEGRHGFIVMERVAGLPFPGWEVDPLFEFEGFAPDAGGLETLADRWERLRPIALGLLEALARLHAVGLVHRDLKPANVLVDAHGVVTLLDLGLACVPDIHPEINGGTAHYAAPEQFDPFGVPSTATDLYAVGIMIYEVLTGEVPHAVGEGGWREMARRRLEVPITLPAGLPPELAATLGALLSIRARERPADAITTITALGGHPGRLLPELDLPGVSPPAALEALFHGPEHFLHLQSDAARELWHRTAGRAELVRRELAAWIRAGLTHKDGDRLRIRRDAIDRLVDGLRVDLTPPSDPVLSGEAGVTLWRLRLAWPDTWPEAVGVSAVARAELVDAGLVWDLPDGRLGLSPVVEPGQRIARRPPAGRRHRGRRGGHRRRTGARSAQFRGFWPISPAIQRTSARHAAAPRARAGSIGHGHSAHLGGTVRHPGSERRLARGRLAPRCRPRRAGCPPLCPGALWGAGNPGPCADRRGRGGADRDRAARSVCPRRSNHAEEGNGSTAGYCRAGVGSADCGWAGQLAHPAPPARQPKAGRACHSPRGVVLFGSLCPRGCGHGQHGALMGTPQREESENMSSNSDVLGGLAQVMKGLGQLIEGIQAGGSGGDGSGDTPGGDPSNLLLEETNNLLKLNEGRQSFTFPAQAEILPGHSKVLTPTNATVADIFASKVTHADGSEVMIEDCVVVSEQLTTFISPLSVTMVMPAGEEKYDWQVASPELFIANLNAQGKTVYRGTWASRHYAPPKKSEVEAGVPAGLVGKAYELKDAGGNVTGHLFRRTATLNGETATNDVWLLLTGYQPPQATTPATTVQIVWVNSTLSIHTDLRAFMIDRIEQDVEFYAATYCRLRKHAP
jgi:serine/threonine protein kinase